MKTAGNCSTINEIREAIDKLDEEILLLLGKRYEYVKEVVRFKKHDKESIVAKNRFDAVISSRRDLAVKNGLNPDVIEKIYRELLNHFIDEEMKIINLKK